MSSMSNFDSSFEVLVLEGERWNVKHVSNNQADAMATAVDLSKRVTSKGVRVIKDFYDAKTGLSYEKVLYEQMKNKQQSKVRMSSG